MTSFETNKPIPIKLGASITSLPGLEGHRPSATTVNTGFKPRSASSLSTSTSTTATYHSLRYNFEPDSIDKTKGALLEDEQGQVTVQFAHLQGGEPYGFSGNQAACKEFDYFLFYCPDSQAFVLEKQHSSINLRNVRKSRSQFRQLSTAMHQKLVVPASSDSTSFSSHDTSVIMHENLGSHPPPFNTDSDEDDLVKEVNDMFAEQLSPSTNQVEATKSRARFDGKPSNGSLRPRGLFAMDCQEEEEADDSFDES